MVLIAHRLLKQISKLTLAMMCWALLFYTKAVCSQCSTNKKQSTLLQCVADKTNFIGENVAKEEGMKVNGVVTEVLGNAMFRVKINDSEHLVTAYIGGKLRKNEIKVIAGDRVLMEMSLYDMTKGRIMYRS